MDLELLGFVDAFQMLLELLKCCLCIVDVEVGAVYHLGDDKQYRGRGFEYFGHGCFVEADDWSGGAEVLFLLLHIWTRRANCVSS